MNQAERDVMAAAMAAVTVERRGNLISANLSRDPQKIDALVRAVTALQTSTGYWAEK